MPVPLWPLVFYSRGMDSRWGPVTMEIISIHNFIKAHYFTHQQQLIWHIRAERGKKTHVRWHCELLELRVLRNIKFQLATDHSTEMCGISLLKYRWRCGKYFATWNYEGNGGKRLPLNFLQSNSMTFPNWIGKATKLSLKQNLIRVW